MIPWSQLRQHCDDAQAEANASGDRVYVYRRRGRYWGFTTPITAIPPDASVVIEVRPNNQASDTASAALAVESTTP